MKGSSIFVSCRTQLRQIAPISQIQVKCSQFLDLTRTFIVSNE